MGYRHLSEVELVEYADGAMASSQVRRVEDHLRACTACTEAVAGARRAAAAVREMRAVAAPESLRQRVAAELAAWPASLLTCREAGPLIHARIDGELAPAGVSALQRHLRGCLRCQAEMAALSSVARLVRSLRAVPAPSAVGEVVWAAVRLRSGQAQRLRPALTPWAVRLRPVLAAAVLAAAGLLVLFRTGERFERPMTPVIATSPGAPTQPAGGPQEGATERGETAVAGLPEAAFGESAGPGEQRPEAAAGEGSRKVERPVGAVGAEARKLRMMASARTALPTASGTFRVEKGPAPEPVGTGQVKVASRLPSAVRTLKEIAMAYAVASEGQQALALAGEKFVTLNSESTLARLPEAAAMGKPAGRPAAGPDAGEPGESKPAPEGEPGRNRAENSLSRVPVA